MAITYVKDIPDFNKKVNELTDITDVKDDIEDIQEDITDIQGDITEIQGDITEIQGDVTEAQGDITTLAGAVTALDTEVDGLEVDSEESTVLTVNSTYQIPENIFTHNLILVQIRRYGVGGYMLVDKIVSGFNSLTIPFGSEYYTFTISETGLFTLTGKSTNAGDPTVRFTGFL